MLQFYFLHVCGRIYCSTSLACIVFCFTSWNVRKVVCVRHFTVVVYLIVVKVTYLFFVSSHTSPYYIWLFVSQHVFWNVFLCCGWRTVRINLNKVTCSKNYQNLGDVRWELIWTKWRAPVKLPKIAFLTRKRSDTSRKKTTKLCLLTIQTKRQHATRKKTHWWRAKKHKVAISTCH